MMIQTAMARKISRKNRGNGKQREMDFPARFQPFILSCLGFEARSQLNQACREECERQEFEAPRPRCPINRK
jgi:hypothetical protein